MLNHKSIPEIIEIIDIVSSLNDRLEQLNRHDDRFYFSTDGKLIHISVSICSNITLLWNNLDDNRSTDPDTDEPEDLYNYLRYAYDKINPVFGSDFL